MMNKPANANKFMLLNILYFIFISRALFLFIIGFTSLNNNIAFRLIVNGIVLNLVPTILYFLVTENPVKETLCLKRLSYKNVFIIILISIFIRPLMSLISLITSMFFPSVVSNIIFETSYDLSYVTMLFIVAILPAVLEEMLSRGIYLSGFKNTSLIKSCLMSGVFFGIMHFNWEQFFYAFAMGSVFAFLVRITGSLYSSIIAHFIINGTSVTGLYLLKFLSRITDMPETLLEELSEVQKSVTIQDIYIMIPSVVIGTLVTIFLFNKLYSLNKQNENLEDIPSANILKNNTSDKCINNYIVDNKDNVIDKYFIISIILYLIYMIIYSRI